MKPCNKAQNSSAQGILGAITGRTSIRAYLDKPVSVDTITAMLDVARFAPSGSNTQPWQVAVVTGHTKRKISDAMVAAHRQKTVPNPDYHYYPRTWIEPYKSRRFQCGMALYGALNIAREEHEKRQALWEANYRFFDAPVGLFFLMDQKLEQGSWMDLGMFLQSVMLAALGLDLATCPQAALAEYPDIVRSVLGLAPDTFVACGMALGYPDLSHPINQYRTDRESVDDFTRWFD